MSKIQKNIFLIQNLPEASEIDFLVVLDENKIEVGFCAG